MKEELEPFVEISDRKHPNLKKETLRKKQNNSPKPPMVYKSFDRDQSYTDKRNHVPKSKNLLGKHSNY
jgi:hypothetical protein